MSTTGKQCPNCNANETGTYKYPPGWSNLHTEHSVSCSDPSAAPIDCYQWDKLTAANARPKCPRPFGPTRTGSPRCESRSIASGGDREYCTCDTCF